MKKFYILPLICMSMLPMFGNAEQTFIKETLENKTYVKPDEYNSYHPFYRYNDLIYSIDNNEEFNPIDYLPDVYPENISTNELLSKVERNTKQIKVIDLKTGLSFYITRYGGYRHLDAEPVSKNDTDIIYSLENFSWNRRAIVLEIDNQYYAASMHTMPHGNGTNNENGFDGHFCIHVSDSTTHGTKRKCPKHFDAIQNALGTNIKALI